jgi:hypothetical protein
VSIVVSMFKEQRSFLVACMIISFLIKAYLSLLYISYSSEGIHIEDDYHSRIMNGFKSQHVNASQLSYRVSFQSPFPILEGKEVVLALQPLYGKHRIKENAIFSLARKYKLEDFLLFVSSLLCTNYTGDLVLGVSKAKDLSRELKLYLEYISKYHHTIVYETHLNCKRVNNKGTFCQASEFLKDRRNNKTIPDPRSPRQLAQLRFEYFWAWSKAYSASSQIWLLDFYDSFFQRHPWNFLPNKNTPTSLHAFEESNHLTLGQEPFNREWIKKVYGERWVQAFHPKTILCAGSTFGGQPAIQTYTSAMIRQFDITKRGLDQGHHNFLFHSNQLIGAPNISSIQFHHQGTSTVNTLGILISQENNLTSLGILRSDGFVYNNDGDISPVIHQYDRDIELSIIMNRRKQKLLHEWMTKRALNARSIFHFCVRVYE